MIKWIPGIPSKQGFYYLFLKDKPEFNTLILCIHPKGKNVYGAFGDFPEQYLESHKHLFSYSKIKKPKKFISNVEKIEQTSSAWVKNKEGYVGFGLFSNSLGVIFWDDDPETLSFSGLIHDNDGYEFCMIDTFG